MENKIMTEERRKVVMRAITVMGYNIMVMIMMMVNIRMGIIMIRMIITMIKRMMMTMIIMATK